MIDRALWFAIVLFMFASAGAWARVFDPKDLNFAPYVRGTAGDSWMHQEGFIHGNDDAFCDSFGEI